MYSLRPQIIGHALDETGPVGRFRRCPGVGSRCRPAASVFRFHSRPSRGVAKNRDPLNPVFAVQLSTGLGLGQRIIAFSWLAADPIHVIAH